MFKNPWFTLIIGLMVGLTLGYVFAERQPVPPGKALQQDATQAAAQAGNLPEGHPPVDEGESASERRFFEQQVAQVQGLLEQNPDDPGLMVAMGDAYFELARATSSRDHWNQAREWYERAMAQGRGNDPNVLTDLAVVYRSLGQQQQSVELLDRAIAADADHWQAWFNRVIILNFDLHDHDGAREAFRRLEAIASDNPEVPDLARIRQEVMGE